MSIEWFAADEAATYKKLRAELIALITWHMDRHRNMFTALEHILNMVQTASPSTAELRALIERYQ